MKISLVIKIILLTFSSNYYTRGLYRLHAGMLNGGTLAIYFPVTATRLFPFEVELYYIQHILILVVPVFLLTSHGNISFSSRTIYFFIFSFYLQAVTVSNP